ncbi:MAG: YihY/virulence factor BrkB family protein [Chloroflexota bacterium]|nr:YihY/virulence factor BrkB family protein [Chloroflexota bacterium]
MSLRTIFKFIQQTFAKWNASSAPRLAASIAYFTAFSLAPVLVFATAIAGAIFSEATVRYEVIRQVRETIGDTAGDLVSGMIQSATRPNEGIISSVLSLFALLLGAIGAFEQLQLALDTIWNVKPPPNTTARASILRLLRDKLLNFGMLIIIGFFLIVSLVISTVTTAVTSTLLVNVDGAGTLLQWLNLGVGSLIIAALFALIYRVMPHTKVYWHDALVGGAVTAVLFTLGRFALSLYLTRSTVTSAYGAAGSLVLILLWIYYSAQIVLLGAAFTFVYGAAREQRRLDALGKPKIRRPLSIKSPRAVGRFIREYIRLPRPNRKPAIRATEFAAPKKPRRPSSYLWGVGVFAAGVAASLFRTRERRAKHEITQKDES